MGTPDGYDFSLTLNPAGDFPEQVNFVLPEHTRQTIADINPFTTRTQSGPLTLASLTHQSAYEQRTFHGGAGQVRSSDDDTRYHLSNNLDPRIHGQVTLFQAVNRTLTTTVQEDGVTLSAGYAAAESNVNTGISYIAGNGGVLQWDGTSYTDVESATLPGSKKVRHLLRAGTSLFASIEMDSIYRLDLTNTAAGWSAIGSAPVHNSNCMIVHDGFIWWAQAGSNLIHYFSQIDGVDAANIGTTISGHPNEDAAGDPAAIEVGHRGGEVKAFASYNKQLYAFRNDGIYRFVKITEHDAVASAWVTRYEPEKVELENTHLLESDANFRALAVWAGGDGAMWFNIRERIFKYTGGGIQDATPQPHSDAFPPTRVVPVGLFGIHGTLFCIMQNGDLYATDGSGWHRLVTQNFSNITRTAWAYNGSYISVMMTSATNIYHLYWPMTDQFARGPYMPSGKLLTSWNSFNFLNQYKYLRRVTVEAHMPDDGLAQISVTAFVRSNGVQTEYYLGVIDHTDGDPLVDGSSEPDVTWNRIIKTFDFPRDAYGKEILLKFTMNAASTQLQSPILYSYIIEYVLRYDTVRGATVMGCEIGSDMRSTIGTKAYKNPARTIGKLREMRDAIVPLLYEDRWGNVAYVYMSSLAEDRQEAEPGARTRDTFTYKGQTIVVREGEKWMPRFSLVEIP